MTEERDEKVLKSGVLRRRKSTAVVAEEVPRTLESEIPAAIASSLKGETIATVTAVDSFNKTMQFLVGAGYTLPGLPVGYFFKGGAAREQLRSLLAGSTEKVFVRDYDVVRYMSTHDALDHELAERFMSDDYEFGRGVEVVEDRQTYFKTRDITQNEVLARAGTLEASWQAVIDMTQGVLRPTAYVTNRRGEVLSATVAKIYRFAAEFQIDGRKYSFADIPDRAFVSPFSAALNLDRSFAKSEAVAKEYVILLWERSRVFEKYEVPPPLGDAVRCLSEKITQGLGLFKHLPMSVLQDLS